MVMRSVREALLTQTFMGQSLINIGMSLIFNFGVPVLIYSKFGARTERAQYPTIAVWAWSYDAGSNISLDMFLTHFLMAMFMTWAGTGAVRKDIHERKLDVLESSVLQKGAWRYTPVLVANTFLRGIAMGFYFSILFYIPMILIVYAALQNDAWAGWPYLLFKAFYSSFFLAPICYVMVFLAAADEANFPGLMATEFERESIGAVVDTSYSDAAVAGAAAMPPGMLGYSTVAGGSPMIKSAGSGHDVESDSTMWLARQQSAGSSIGFPVTNRSSKAVAGAQK